MKNYELTYLISPHLSPEDFKTLQEKVNSFVREGGGILDQAEYPIKKRLGYSIKNKTMAYLATLNFHCESAGISTIEKKLKAESQILRYAILTKRAEAAKVPKRIFKPRVKPAPLTLEEERYLPKEKKVELKEIEKKLEEILGE